ncbi:hypothetical protein OF83DRAFT_1170370 [Amylostereum chailletii]|nr:hypothetical protein OF83DRAFT_1170370 [Amylostereum chailletii]
MALQAVKRFRFRELRSPRLTHEPVLSSPSTSTTPSASQHLTRPNPFLPHKNPATGRWAPPKYSLRRQADLIKQARASGTLHLLPPGLKYKPEGAIVIPSPSQAAPGKKEGDSSKAEVSEPEAVAPKVIEQILPEVALTEAVVTPSKAKWDGTIAWVGTVPDRNVAGADVGNRLYAGKKRMFKGHKWERMRVHRARRTKGLLRDMDTRIKRFKRWHTRGKPKPLVLGSGKAKPQKLPF